MRARPAHPAQRISRLGVLAWVGLTVALLLFGFGYLVQSIELEGLAGTLVGAGVLVLGFITVTLWLSADPRSEQDSE